jgi:EmrB/QacA subfamily drug resistance transporter
VAEKLTDETFCPPKLRTQALAAAILASSLGFIDGTVVSIALPSIRASLDASLTEAQWFAAAYALMLSSLVMAGGALGDRFGIRRTFAAGIGVFILSSLVCAMAANAMALIAARVLQGTGAAIMVPGSLALIAKAYPPQERGRAIGIWASASAATSAFGPLAGGLLLAATGDEGWRLVFAINLPLGLLALALLWPVPDDVPDYCRKLDISGVILATASLGMVALGLTGGFAGEGDSGIPVPDWTLTAFGTCLFAAFLFWQAKAASPMMPLDLFADRAFAGANLATFLLYFALGALLFFLPMTLIAAWRLDTATTALVFMPVALLVGAMSGPVGRLSGRQGVRLYMAGGSAVCAAGFAILAATTHLQDFWFAVMPCMGLIGVGFGLLVSPLSVAVMTTVPDHQTGMASAINNTVARLSGLMATASLGGIAAAVHSSQFAGQTSLSFGEIPPTGLDPVLLVQFSQASNAAFSAIAAISAAFSLLAAAICLLMLPARKAR